jgi:hypothetical protein
MGPREIMLEHIEFWTSGECPPMSEEDMELIKKLAAVVGVTLAAGKMVKLVEHEAPEVHRLWA